MFLSSPHFSNAKAMHGNLNICLWLKCCYVWLQECQQCIEKDSLIKRLQQESTLAKGNVVSKGGLFHCIEYKHG
jgi:hypothetical protein